MMIVIAGSARVRADVLDSALRTASKMAESSRAEDGCIDYRFAIDIDDPSTVRLFEQWESEAALQSHFATAHFAEFSHLLVEILDGPPSFTKYVVASTGPLSG